MDELRPDELAAAVAAWHNRHPLARRITPAQVQGIGWVALPFVQRPGAAPWSAPAAVLPVLDQPVDGARASAAPGAGTRLRDRALAQAQAATPAAGPAATATPGLAAAPRQLLSTFKQALHAALTAPARLRTYLQAARQQRAQARLRAQALLPAFSEDFISPLRPRQVARWALRHGRLHARIASLPLREVRADAQWGRQDSGLVTLYLATAAVEVGARRARVLLPPGGAGGLLGPRLMSPQRSAAVLGLLAAVALGIARPPLPAPADWPGVAAVQNVLARWSALAAGGGAGEPVAPVASAASAVSAAASGSAADATWAAAEPASAATEAAPAWAEAASMPDVSGAAVAVAAAAPASQALAQAGLPLAGADPEGGAATLPPDDPPPRPPAEPFRPGQRLVPPLDEATKTAARETVAALRVARGEPPPSAKPAAAGVLALAPNLARPPLADPGPELGPAYALTTRPLRTRAESEQVQMAVRALLAQHTAEPLLVELMPAGDDWRVVCWPFSRRQDAQLARALLLTRGLRMEAVEF